MSKMASRLLAVFVCVVCCTGGFLPALGLDLPRITPRENEKVISVGWDIKLECTAKQPVYWTSPQPSDKTVNIIYMEKRGAEYPYEAHLMKSAATYKHTGFYRCTFNGSFDQDKDKSSSIYIYVKSEKEDELLTSTHDKFLVGRQYQSVTIPCRPTSPAVRVELLMDGDPVKSRPGTLTVTYDPKYGFTLANLNTVDNGEYQCVASLGTKKLETIAYVNVLAFIELGKPSLNITKNHIVQVASDLYIMCQVTGTEPHFNWRIPYNDSKVIRSSETIIGSPDMLVPGAVTRAQVLTIHNISYRHEGDYTCTAKDDVTNQSTHDTMHLKVVGLNHFEVKLSVKGPEMINVTAGKVDYVQWVVMVDAFPKPKIVWWAPNGTEINPRNTSSKFNITTDEHVTSTILRINDVRSADTGIYQVKAINNPSSKTGSDHLNLALVVFEKPSVKCEGKDYYNESQIYHIKCQVTGSPPPEVEWSYKECSSPSDCKSRHFTKLPPINYTQPKAVNKKVWTTLSIEAQSSGYITCTAKNGLGKANDTLKFFVTDVGAGFKVWGPTKPVEGDNVTLSCGASVHNYSDVTWYWLRKGYGFDVPVPNDTVHQIKKITSKFSHQTYIQIQNITKSENGLYTCNARKLYNDSSNEERGSLNLKVQDMMAPVIKVSNLNGTEWTYGEGEQNIRLTCEAQGAPKPTIQWYRDKRLLHNDNNTYYEFGKENKSMIIKFTTLKVQGWYSCVASNRINTATRKAFLKITEASQLDSALLSGIVICSIAFIVLIAFLLFKIRKERKLRKELAMAGLMHFEDGAIENLNPDLPVDEQADLLPYNNKWEFPRDKLKLGKQLGAGAFGVVLKADAWGIVEGETVTTVAVKMVKRNAGCAYIKALASELKIMVHLGKHLNVVNLLGACTKTLTKASRGELLVIVEYCRYGNLHNYLLRHREAFIDQVDPTTRNFDPSIGREILSLTKAASKTKLKHTDSAFSSSGSSHTSKISYWDDERGQLTGSQVNFNISTVPSGASGEDASMLSNNSIQPEWRSNYRSDYKGTTRPIATRDLVCWAFQVARGMEYLSSRRVMHGDLAARNILLADDNIVKICDFGLAKSMYKSDNYKTKGDGPLPIKWMAIESIRDRIFSTQSDVWSFGIVLWELFSLARTPYPGMEADEKLYNKLLNGYRMEQPPYATEEIYQIMLGCWCAAPRERPSFPNLVEQLGSMLECDVRKHYMDLNNSYIKMNSQWMSNSSSDYLSMMNAPTYGNMVSPSYDPDHKYVNSFVAVTKPAEEDGETSGYLHMKAPVEKHGAVFSPRKSGIDETVFSTHQKETGPPDGTASLEMKPMPQTFQAQVKDVQANPTNTSVLEESNPRSLEVNGYIKMSKHQARDGLDLPKETPNQSDIFSGFPSANGTKEHESNNKSDYVSGHNHKNVFTNPIYTSNFRNPDVNCYTNLKA